MNDLVTKVLENKSLKFLAERKDLSDYQILKAGGV